MMSTKGDCPHFEALAGDGSVGGAQVGEALDRHQQRFSAGDNKALLDAFNDCAAFRVIPPDWVLFEVGRALRSYTEAEVRTLDEAFHVSRRKSENLEGTRNTVMLTNGIRLAVRMAKRKDPSRTIDHDLFDEIGEAFRISASTCANIYYGR